MRSWMQFDFDCYCAVWGLSLEEAEKIYPGRQCEDLMFEMLNVVGLVSRIDSDCLSVLSLLLER